MLSWLRFFVFAVLAFLAVGLGDTAMAQLDPSQREYYDEWLKTAERAEEVVEAERASDAAFENLREEVAVYRENFNQIRTHNSARIQTLQSQLEALGPVPEEGEEEPEDIARLRASLNQQLDELRVPRVIAEEAHSRADGLIREIDRVIRERQADQILSRGPSPLNPVHWQEAWQVLKRIGSSITNELVTNARSDTVREQTRDRLPIILVLLALAAVLLIKGKRWSELAGSYLRSIGATGSGVWSFVISLLRILLPWLGVVAVVAAISLTGLPGLRGALLLEQIPYWASIILYFNWIGRQIYLMRSADEIRLIPEGRVREIRFHIDSLAVLLVLFQLVLLIERIENLSPGARSVLAFPLVLLSAITLLRLNMIREPVVEKPTGASDEENAAHAGIGALVEVVRKILYILGILSPILAAAGYVYASETIIFPAVRTLALLAALVIVHRFMSNLYGWISGAGDAARDSLFSVLIGFVLAIAALPILALYWGARRADLTELWSRILEGFDVGGIRVSPTNFLIFVVIFLIGYALTRLLQSGLRTSLLPKTRIDPGGQNAIVAGTGYVGIFLAALIAITGAGFDLSSLAIVAGALSVGIGFGLQTIVSNFVSGIILLVERPISKGDWIDVNGLMGYVRDISVRSTRIETFDRTDVIIPNSDLITGTVTNYTRGNTVGRVIVPVGVAYSTDPRKVEMVLDEIAKAHPMVLLNPAPTVVFQGFGTDSLNFEIRAILRDVNWVLSVKSDMNYEIARRFKEEGIEIPFAQRDVWLRNPETLVPKTEPTATGASADSMAVSSSPTEMSASDMDGDPDNDA